MAIRGWFCFWLGLLWFALSLLAAPLAQAQERGSIYSVQIDGIVTSIKVDYLRRTLQVAEANDATALIIQLSNNGGVLRAIRPFAAELAEAEVPVVVYVAPPGTESGAPGAFFLSAAHVAAMAPDTSFGAPVPLAEVDETLSEQTQNLVLDSVVEQLREWNERRNRNTDWIDEAVREGVVRSNTQAMATTPPTIDLTASNTEELLTLLEGRVVELDSGEEVQLSTLGRSPTPIEPTLWESLLLLLANPTVAFLLLVMGAIAVYAELATPGVGIAAGIGSVLLLGSLVGLLVLPVRPVSLGGLVIAFTLIAADLYLSTHGVLTVVGLVALIVSAMTLIDTAQAPNVFIAFWAILVVALSLAAFAAVAIWVVVHTRNTPVSTGQEGLVGRLAEVRKRLDPQGMVFVDGALWRAVSEDGVVEEGDWVRVRSVHDLRLVVRSIDSEATERANE
jgi:membrane-bound serine protease (ClpP class)